MKLTKYLVSVLLGLCVTAAAQTNSFYNQGEITIALAPTVSSQSFLSKRGLNNLTEGLSYKTAYWQTKNLATGLEFGSYDWHEANYGVIIDHITVTEIVRAVPFSGPILDRFAVELKTGAETYLIDGSKNLEVGLGGDFALSHKWRLQGNYDQHFRLSSTKTGGTFTLSITRVF